MRKTTLCVMLCVNIFSTEHIYAQEDLLKGKVRRSCEAILCLSTGNPPSACEPALKEYFSIKFSKPWKTIRERLKFLKLCPET